MLFWEWLAWLDHDWLPADANVNGIIEKAIVCMQILCILLWFICTTQNTG